MSNITWGLQRDVKPRLEPGWYRKATGCTIWLTGPASPVSSAKQMPEAG
jgi:hypothetical protein